MKRKSLLAWKYCRTKAGKQLVLKVRIPVAADRVNVRKYKSRAEFVKTVAVYEIQINDEYGRHKLGKRLPDNTMAYSGISSKIAKYKVGKVTYPDRFDSDRRDNCSNGIHFHMKLQDALDWVF